MATVVPISAAKIYQNNDTLEKVRLSYYLDPAAFVNAFAKIGIPISNGEQFIPYLANLIDTGGDINGVVLDSNGNPIYFNGINMILHKVKPSNQSLSNSGVKIS